MYSTAATTTNNFGLMNANYGEFRYKATSALQRVPSPVWLRYRYSGINISGSFLLVRHQVLDLRLIHTYEVPGLCPVQRPPVFDFFFIFLWPCTKIPSHYHQTDRHHFLSYHYTLTIPCPTSISYAANVTSTDAIKASKNQVFSVPFGRLPAKHFGSHVGNAQDSLTANRKFPWTRCTGSTSVICP